MKRIIDYKGISVETTPRVAHVRSIQGVKSRYGSTSIGAFSLEKKKQRMLSGIYVTSLICYRVIPSCVFFSRRRDRISHFP